MPMDTLFLIYNYGVFPFWLLLIFAPRAVITERLVHSGLVPVLYGASYTVLLVSGLMGDAVDGAGFDSLQGLIAALGTPQAMLTGWIHYLVFDLFVGAWIARDSAREGVPHLAIVPILIFTLMAGPLGLLVYMIVRYAMKKKFSLAEI